MNRVFGSQEKRLDYLVQALREDSGCGRHLAAEGGSQRAMMRSLMNIRMPGPISGEFLRVQDEFLQQEAKEKGIVDPAQIPTVGEQYGYTGREADRISLWQGDITRLKTDAIVNAANSQMLGCFVPCHKCIDNAIHSAAGIELREECACLMRQQGHEEPVGRAKITGAYNLPCGHVIHTVGPIVAGAVTKEDCELLRSCYESCLETAEESGLKTIAFCCISTGEFHFPGGRASEIAVRTVEDCLGHSSLERVIFNVFKDCDLKTYENLFKVERGGRTNG